MSTLPLTYEDFIVELTGGVGNDQARVRVLSSPVGGMTPSTATPIQIDWETLEWQVTQWSCIEEESLIRLGITLADLILPQGLVRPLYWRSLDRARDRGRGLRLRLRFDDPRLELLPWELLYVDRGWGRASPNDFLALQATLSITRQDIVSPTRARPAAAEQIRFPRVTAAPKGLPPLQFDEERMEIERAFAVVKREAEAVSATWLSGATSTRLHTDLREIGRLDIWLYRDSRGLYAKSRWWRGQSARKRGG